MDDSNSRDFDLFAACDSNKIIITKELLLKYFDNPPCVGEVIMSHDSKVRHENAMPVILDKVTHKIELVDYKTGRNTSTNVEIVTHAIIRLTPTTEHGKKMFELTYGKIDSKFMVRGSYRININGKKILSEIISVDLFYGSRTV